MANIKTSNSCPLHEPQVQREGGKVQRLAWTTFLGLAICRVPVVMRMGALDGRVGKGKVGQVSKTQRH